MNLLDKILARLDCLSRTRTGWMARCPAHSDRTPSLSIRIGTGGRVLLHCFAGCSYRAIRRALGLPVPEAAKAKARKTSSKPAWHQFLRGRLADEARPIALREGRRQQIRLLPYRDLFRSSDLIREAFRQATLARREATRFGDTPTAWSLLAYAAEQETIAQNLEAAVDDVLGGGPLA